MTKIEIQNIGPIVDVSFELSKINVLMGPQSSGKSTIAKIISYCQWAEKRYLLDGKFEYDVFEQLLEFHRLNENYFSESSLFIYESEFIKIQYKGKKLKSSFRKKNTKKIYKKSKNIYIPSERNFVSVIPNLAKYKETNDNIMSFVYDWFTAKRMYNSQNSLSVLNLGVKFYNKVESDNDVLLLQNKKEILLREGSSGLQSVIPLIVLIEYLTEHIYTNNVNSVEERDSLKKYLIDNISKILNVNNINEIDKLSSLDINENDLKKIILSYHKTQFLKSYYHTNFIIEEPEQNLFPTTQRDLINYLFLKMKDEKEHSLLLTTHSPYILYAINNCLMGHNVKNNLSEEEFNEFSNSASWTNPNDVSIWQVQDGTLVSVKDIKTKTVTKHYFNEITKDIMDEYYEMLNNFEYDSQN